MFCNGKLNKKTNTYPKSSICKECDQAYSLKRRWNMTEVEFSSRFSDNCAICGVHQDNLKVRLNIDHDHDTGKIRDVICNSCNREIGYLKDGIEIVERALTYLRKHKQ
jgi:hypothetical protein